MRVILVEDDPMIGESVQNSLKDSSYAVDWVQNGEQALQVLSCHHYDLMLLDLGLPKKDGLTVLATLRQQHNSIPVLIITARDKIEDRIQGLDMGADDYLLKPFATGELLARIRAICRRKSGQATPLLGNGVVTLDPATHEAKVAQGASFILTNREYSLLHALLVRPGAILSRNELEESIYGWGDEVESNAVDVLIHGLRKKLGSNVIKNVRGVGWMVGKNN